MFLCCSGDNLFSFSRLYIPSIILSTPPTAISCSVIFIKSGKLFTTLISGAFFQPFVSSFTKPSIRPTNSGTSIISGSFLLPLGGFSAFSPLNLGVTRTFSTFSINSTAFASVGETSLTSFLTSSYIPCSSFISFSNKSFSPCSSISSGFSFNSLFTSLKSNSAFINSALAAASFLIGPFINKSCISFAELST